MNSNSSSEARHSESAQLADDNSKEANNSSASSDSLTRRESTTSNDQDNQSTESDSSADSDSEPEIANLVPARTDYKQQARAVVATNRSMAQVPYCDPTVDLEQFAEIITTKYFGEFTWSGCFDSDFIARLMYYGFLPMSSTTGCECFLLPKIHVERCVMKFADLHVPKKMKKLAKRFTITIDQSFDEVVEQINIQHGAVSWFYPPLVEGYRGILTRNYTTGTLDGLVRLHSVELRKEGKLVAGEVGYACGASFTSLSGFRTISSSGTVQCVILAMLLERCGFKFWDLGMGMEYKIDLGAKEIPRSEFLSLLHQYRDAKGVLLAHGGDDVALGENCGEILRKYMEAHENIEGGERTAVEDSTANESTGKHDDQPPPNSV